MKLNAAQIEAALRQTGGEAIPVDHPLIPKLTELFGEHTYFLDDRGLNIIEPARSGEPGDDQFGVVVNLADWANDGQPKLNPHPPEVTDLLVDLAA
jgi:hypothetical protein